jgi:D-glycero-alpha-D-manno-heptose-7-phosphate kinase
MSFSVRKILEQGAIEASAPCRIDAGGTWDIKAMALPMEALEPTTVNFALNLRTRVRLSAFREGWVKISSEGFSQQAVYRFEKIPFNSHFGLFFAAIGHFGFSGLRAHIQSESPVKSGLGGSSTALIALLKALSKLSIMLGRGGIPPRDMLFLGYHLEDGVSGGHCGIQDQAAAVYGGVNQWTWRFGKRCHPFGRMPLLRGRHCEALSERILVAFSGKSHVSSRTNRAWIQGFLSGATRSGWVEANRIVHDLAEAIKARSWDAAAKLLREEMAVRKKITPDAFIQRTRSLIDLAEEAGCGARFAGAGAGGSVWALGEVDRIHHLEALWKRCLGSFRGARMINCRIDSRGVI